MTYSVGHGNKAQSSGKEPQINLLCPKSRSALHRRWSSCRLYWNNYSRLRHNNLRYIVNVNIHFSAITSIFLNSISSIYVAGGTLRAPTLAFFCSSNMWICNLMFSNCCHWLSFARLLPIWFVEIHELYTDTIGVPTNYYLLYVLVSSFLKQIKCQIMSIKMSGSFVFKCHVWR